jgi:HTH-type transcriptional regulator / antitoxin HipB
MEPFDLITFANAVCAQRPHLGLRQDELADLAGVSERFVYTLESGKRSVQLDKVVAGFAALGLHLELHRGGSPRDQTHHRRWGRRCCVI